MIEAGTVLVLKERERREKESDEEMKDDFQALVLNGDSQQLSSSRFSSLLASKDRDYLLSPTGAQVLSLSLHSFTRPGCFIWAQSIDSCLFYKFCVT